MPALVLTNGVMVMFRFTGILLCAMSAGCASVSEMVKKPAYATFTTENNPEAVAQCIRDSWQDTRFRGLIRPATLQRDGDIFRVVELGPDVVAVIDGNRVSLHFSWQPVTIDGAFKRNRIEALTPCL
jgi:hypothetical protein